MATHFSEVLWLKMKSFGQAKEKQCLVKKLVSSAMDSLLTTLVLSGPLASPDVFSLRPPSLCLRRERQLDTWAQCLLLTLQQPLPPLRKRLATSTRAKISSAKLPACSDSLIYSILRIQIMCAENFAVLCCSSTDLAFNAYINRSSHLHTATSGGRRRQTCWLGSIT